MDYKHTVNANVYRKQLPKLADAFKEKRPKAFEVALLHDNATPHTAKLTRDFPEKIGWTIICNQLSTALAHKVPCKETGCEEPVTS